MDNEVCDDVKLEFGDDTLLNPKEVKEPEKVVQKEKQRSKVPLKNTNYLSGIRVDKNGRKYRLVKIDSGYTVQFED